jgi:hypothetical protein
MLVARCALLPPLLAGALALICLGVVASRLLAPAPMTRWPLAAPAPRAAAARVAGGHWFGEAPRLLQAPPSLTVIGVYAPQGTAPGFVIADEGGHEFPLVVGATSPGGWTLRRATPAGALMAAPDGGERLLPLAAARSALAAGVGAGSTPGSMSSSDALQPIPLLPAPGTP